MSDSNTTTATKPVKVSSYRGESTYTFGKWLVYTKRRSESTYSCGMRRTTSWTTWSAHTRGTEDAKFADGTGGIRDAAKALAKL
jgi:hypothetical protein